MCVCEIRKQAAQCKDGEGQEGRKEILLEKCPQRQKPKNPLQCNNPPEGLFTLTGTAELSISHRPDETITMAKLTFLWLIQDLYQTRKHLSVVVSQKGKNWHSFYARTEYIYIYILHFGVNRGTYTCLSILSLPSARLQNFGNLSLAKENNCVWEIFSKTKAPLQGSCPIKITRLARPVPNMMALGSKVQKKLSAATSKTWLPHQYNSKEKKIVPVSVFV